VRGAPIEVDRAFRIRRIKIMVCKIEVSGILEYLRSRRPYFTHKTDHVLKEYLLRWRAFALG